MRSRRPWEPRTVTTMAAEMEVSEPAGLSPPLSWRGPVRGREWRRGRRGDSGRATAHP